MKIGVLTSSRADFGIYLPLLKALQEDPFFSFEIIAFGTDLSKQHGHTIDDITDSGCEVQFKLDTAPSGDSAKAIATSMGHTVKIFADFWEQHKAGDPGARESSRAGSGQQ